MSNRSIFTSYTTFVSINQASCFSLFSSVNTLFSDGLNILDDRFSITVNDILVKDKSSVIYKHHIEYVKNNNRFYKDFDYETEEPNQIVVDYIASMTDDYFMALHEKLFPDSKHRIEYKSYFD